MKTYSTNPQVVLAAPRKRHLIAAAIAGLSILPVTAAWASDTCAVASTCGQKSGLVPFHKDAIHASLTWAGAAQCPRMLIWMRPSEYKPDDYLAETADATFPGFNQDYIDLVQGGFPLGRLDESGWSRHAPDRARENAQLIDVCGLQAQIDSGTFVKTEIPQLGDADIAATAPYFADAGFSRGLNYNLFCTGHAAGADGKLYVFGNHDKGGNNGGRKVNIFEAANGRWLRRPAPCVRTQFAEDPTGTAFEHCDALDENNTDPPLASDMRYQRWYPSAIPLPDGRFLILSGSDQDTSVGPDDAAATKVRQPVPEVYDPKTDRHIALENTRKLLPMYPRAFVVQTGAGVDDWKVCTAGEVQSPLPGTPGGANIRSYDPFAYNGNTWCLDVRAALADPARDTPAENHWQFVATARNAHDSGAGVMQVTIHADGTWSQKVYAFGGSNNRDVVAGVAVDAANVATIESIDYSDPAPSWRQHSDLVQPATQNNAVALPDGKILIVGGRDDENNSLHYQMFDPADGSITQLVDSPVPRHDHSTALLLPDGGVWVMGGNRVDLLPNGDRNLAVPVMEAYRPPYFFQGPRPSIVEAPDRIAYGRAFNLQTAGDAESVVIIRTGPVTHNWTWGNRYVKLPALALREGRLSVTAPPLPGLAPAGDYLLFVVGQGGVPSAARHVRLGLAK